MFIFELIITSSIFNLENTILTQNKCFALPFGGLSLGSKYYARAFRLNSSLPKCMEAQILVAYDWVEKKIAWLLRHMLTYHDKHVRSIQTS